MIDFDAAVAAALAEDAPESDDLGTIEIEDSTDQAVSIDGEQTDEPIVGDADADGETTEEDDLFADIEVEVPQPAPQIDASTAFQLPGIEQPVTLQELKDGYLRTADYTRKTQEVAAQRKQLDQAARLWQALEADPLGVATTLAKKAGLIPEDATPMLQLDLAPLRTREEQEAEINRRVEQVLANHPTVLRAAKTNADAWIAQEFSRVEQLAGRTLSKESKVKLLRKATELGVTDLTVVFNHLLAERTRKQQAAAQLREAAPAKPSARAVTRESEPKIESFEDAVKVAAIQVGT